VDLVEAVATTIPPRVMFAMLDLPIDEAVAIYHRDMKPVVAFRQNNQSGHEEALRAHDRLIAFVEGRMRCQPAWATVEALRRGQRTDVSGAELVEAIAHLMVAGTETTICGLSNLFFLIAEHQASWEAVLDGRVPERVFVHEVLRFEPPAPRTFRFAAADTAVASTVDVARDAIVELCLRQANRSDDRIDEPNGWNPQPGRGVGATFGFGRHACFGRYLAVAEMLEVVAVLRWARFRPQAVCVRAPMTGPIFRRSPRIIANLGGGS
jgi:cytochrome P450